MKTPETEVEEAFIKFVEPALDNGFDDGYRGADPEKAQKAYRDRYAWILDIKDFFQKQLHHQLQKVREEERGKFYKMWKERFGAEVILWDKGEKEAISVYDFLTPLSDQEDKE